MFCRHKWDKKSEVVLPSLIEQQLANGRVTELKIRHCDIKIAGSKTVVIVLSCEKCGKLKKFVERS